MSNRQEKTVINAIIDALEKQGRCVLSEETPPAAILWTDEKQQFLPLLDRFRKDIPQFLTLGEYNPEVRCGPAIWIRAMVDKALPEANWDANIIPIVYLPGYSRQRLRAVDDCPPELRPLAELQYRGTIWSQYNARNWTIAAFLQSDQGGLGLEVAGDQDTLDAFKNSLVKLADVLIKDLRNRRIDSNQLDDLVHPDFIRTVLIWLNDPQNIKDSWNAAEWESFCKLCKQKLDFDPEGDGEITAGEKLGNNEGDWYSVWNRYAEAPTHYPNIKELLRKSRPVQVTEDLFSTTSNWPQDNEKEENSLRTDLEMLENVSPDKACNKIMELERQHKYRRDTVWAKLGEASLANALEYLNIVASQISKFKFEQKFEDLVNSYASTGWRIDAAVLQTLDKAKQPIDSKVVRKAISSIYKDWLERVNEKFQEIIDQTEYKLKNDSLVKPEIQAGTCFLFVDGLRFDVGQLLIERLEKHGFDIVLEWKLSAYPSVTATSKIAISPIAYKLSTSSDRDDFTAITKENKTVDHNLHKKLLEEDDIQFLNGDELGDPSGISWTECGTLDKTGHNQQWKISWRIDEEIEVVANRIKELISAGWQRIEIITDHGWLMLPGGLPKVELKNYLVDTRWRRCAKLKETSHTDFQTLPWFWNSSIQIAIAPGIHMFVAGSEYAHGGLSLQECVIPHIYISVLRPERMASIVSAKWVRLRCRVLVKNGENYRLDIRSKAMDESTSLLPQDLDPIKINDEGEATLLVENPEMEGKSAIIVVLDENGQVNSKYVTIIGE